MTRVLVTGGSGFVGRQVVPHLCAAGLEVMRADARRGRPAGPRRCRPGWRRRPVPTCSCTSRGRRRPATRRRPPTPTGCAPAWSWPRAFAAAGGRRIVAAGLVRRARPGAADALRRLQARAAPRPARARRPSTASSWPGRGCSSCTAPASIPSGSSPRSRQPRRRRGGARDRRPPAPRLPRRPRRRRGDRRPDALGSATGLFDVATGNAPAVADIARAIATAADRPGLLRLGALPSPDEAPLIVGDPRRVARRDRLVPADHARRRPPRRGRRRLKESDRLPMSTAMSAQSRSTA